MARTRLSLPVHRGSSAARPLRPDGCPHTAPPFPQPFSGPVQPYCCRSGGRGPGLPPRRLRPAAPPVSPHQAALPVPHPLHSWRSEARGEQSPGAAVLQPGCAGARASGRRVELERAGAHAHRTQPPLCGCNGELPVCCGW